MDFRDDLDAIQITPSYKIHCGDSLAVLKTLPDQSVNCCVTSPPYYGLRDYGIDGQIGLESTPDEFVDRMVSVFREVRRVLRDDGTFWLNLGDSYAGSGGPGSWVDNKQTEKFKDGFEKYKNPNRDVIGIKPKNLIGIPWMVAFALRNDGWNLRSDIIWSKANPMPESVTDRPTKSHEYIFLLSKSPQYYYDHEAIKEPCVDGDGRKDLNPKHRKRYPTELINGVRDRSKSYSMRNKRSVWSVPTRPYAEAHFATYPPDLILPCVLAGCPLGGVVLDPFSGSGTTGQVALENGRNYIGIELNPEYAAMSERRLVKVAYQPPLMFALPETPIYEAVAMLQEPT